MTIYVTGDLHGGMDSQKLYDWEVGLTLSRDDYLIVAGDFGYPWDFSEEEEYDLHWLEQGPFTLLFVDGNHERYDWWAERPYEQELCSACVLIHPSGVCAEARSTILMDAGSLPWAALPAWIKHGVLLRSTGGHRNSPMSAILKPPARSWMPATGR